MTTETILNDETIASLLLDFWMYDIIDKALTLYLQKKLSSKSMQREWDAFQSNKFHTLGQINLSQQRIKEIQSNHSDLLKSLLFFQK